MLKKLLFGLALFLFTSLNVFAENVENVFVDVDVNYQYKKELQLLYDKGIIYPDENGNFSPQTLLNRDEFVAMSMHSMCKECILPYTDVELFSQYSETKPFFDISENNKYFYCIADAQKNNFVAGYNSGHVCEDGTTKTGEKPFCENNKITLEEAVAVLLRNAKIFTQEQNSQIISQIQSGEITQNISNDVGPFTKDGNSYTFYGYLQKALSYKVVDYDEQGNQTTYFLISKDGLGNLNPKKSITREEFLKLAFVIAKTTSCSPKQDSAGTQALATKIDLFPSSCSVGQNCSSEIPSGHTNFDLKNTFQVTCESGIKEVKWYFINQETGENFTREGEYLENFEFPIPGKWLIRSVIFDNCGNVGESKIELDTKTSQSLGVFIVANPIFGVGPLKVDFASVVNGCSGVCSYTWNFGDGNFSNEKNPIHIFQKSGVYGVQLGVRDPNGNFASAKVNIVVDEKSSLGSQILVQDSRCNITDVNCTPANIGDNSGKYDFYADVVTSCRGGISQYEWFFENLTNSETFSKTGKYLNDIIFPSFGEWKIASTVRDNCGSTTVSYAIISYVDTSKSLSGSILSPSIGIIASPISGIGPLDVDFSGVIGGCENCSISWNFGDGNTGNGKDISHTFPNPGVYEVIATLTDNDGNIYQAKVNIYVSGNGQIVVPVDTDGDGVFDGEDKCPTVFGEKSNFGCPILNFTCNPSAQNSCGVGLSCSSAGICVPETLQNNTCLIPTSGSAIFGKTSCNSCPCQLGLDFLANIRACDQIFPAIVSPDASEIFSRGELFLVPKN